MTTLKPLTVNIVRTNYWDKKEKKGRKILYYMAQTFDGLTGGDEHPTTKNMSKSWFKPDGDLRQEYRGEVTIHSDWLSKSRIGPYKRGEGSSPVFFYLTGTGPDGPMCVQICSAPLNILSRDCLDAVHMWIPKR